MIQDVLATLRAEHQSRFRGFLAARQEPADVLERELSQYIDLLRTMSRRIQSIDLDVVLRIEAACRGLLQQPNLTTEGSALVNAAVRYFLRKEEEHEDSTAVLSFNDDVEILNAVSRSLDRRDLVIPTLEP